MSRVIRRPDIQPPAVVVGEEEYPQSDLVEAEATAQGAAEFEGSAASLDFETLAGEPELEIQPPEPLPDPEEIIRQAREEAAVLIEADRTSARAEGHQEGLEAAAAKTEAIITRLAALVDGAALEFAEALRRSQADAVHLCLAIGERIARKALASEGGALARIVEEGLGRAANDVSITVRIHPDDEALLGPHWDRLIAARNGKANVVKQLEPSMERGGCVIEAGGGRVDASLAARLEAVRQSLGSDPSAGEGNAAEG